MKLVKPQLQRYRYAMVLLRELVITDFKLKYQGSVLGYTWSVLRPLFLFATLYLVFGVFIKVGATTPHYPIVLLLGIVLWSFFADMTNQSLPSIVNRGDLIRKIRIPRWLIVVSASLAALINLAFSLIIVVIFAAFNDVSLQPTVLLFPLFILEVYLFALGVSLFLSSLFVKYRDLTYIWEVLMQAGFYLTPIIWPLTLLNQPLLQKLVLINPMAQAIQGARHTAITNEVMTITDVFGNAWAILIPLSIVAVILVTGILFFKKQAKTFAEDL